MDDLSAAELRQRQFNELRENGKKPARDVPPGELWAFVEHRSMAEIIAAEGQP